LDKAFSFFTRALQLKPDFAAAHNGLGVVLARQGKIHDAVYHFREAVRLDPNFVRAENNLRTALQQKQRSQRSGESIRAP
jgi:Flp pilus assembly protein TadD